MFEVQILKVDHLRAVCYLYVRVLTPTTNKEEHGGQSGVMKTERKHRMIRKRWPMVAGDVAGNLKVRENSICREKFLRVLCCWPAGRKSPSPV